MGMGFATPNYYERVTNRSGLVNKCAMLRRKLQYWSEMKIQQDEGES